MNESSGVEANQVVTIRASPPAADGCTYTCSNTCTRRRRRTQNGARRQRWSGRRKRWRTLVGSNQRSSAAEVKFFGNGRSAGHDDLNYRFYGLNGIDGDRPASRHRRSLPALRRGSVIFWNGTPTQVGAPTCPEAVPKKSNPFRRESLESPQRRRPEVVSVLSSVNSVQSSVVQTLWSIPSGFASSSAVKHPERPFSTPE